MWTEKLFVRGISNSLMADSVTANSLLLRTVSIQLCHTRQVCCLAVILTHKILVASFPGSAQLSIASSTASDRKLGVVWERG